MVKSKENTEKTPISAYPSEVDLACIKKAAELERRSVSGFIIHAAVEKAKELIKNDELL